MTLRHALESALEYLDRHNVWVDFAIVDAIKSLSYFSDKIDRLTLDLYRGSISQSDFENSMVDVIDQQLDKAWREGMRKNELDPAADMTPEMDAELERLKLNEVDFIEGYGQAIVDAADKDTQDEQPKASLPGLKVRGSIWANRYTDTVNIAVEFTAEPKDRLEWVYGDTEHCDTCAVLNGIVASAQEWADAGLHPQRPPNDALDCGGWQCKCSLEPTDKKRSRNRQDIFDSLRL